MDRMNCSTNPRSDGLKKKHSRSYRKYEELNHWSPHFKAGHPWRTSGQEISSRIGSSSSNFACHEKAKVKSESRSKKRQSMSTKRNSKNVSTSSPSNTWSSESKFKPQQTPAFAQSLSQIAPSNLILPIPPLSWLISQVPQREVHEDHSMQELESLLKSIMTADQASDNSSHDDHPGGFTYTSASQDPWLYVRNSRPLADNCDLSSLGGGNSECRSVASTDNDYDLRSGCDDEDAPLMSRW